MGRPQGPVDYQRRLRAYEMYAAGIKKADIAHELGVTRPAIGNWAKQDRWDEKLLGIVARAEEALNNKTGDQVAATLYKLRAQLATRVVELESLCIAGNAPATRLAAIKQWFELAGIKRAIPNPTDPTTPKSLELIEDLLTTDHAKNSSDQRVQNSVHARILTEEPGEETDPERFSINLSKESGTGT